MALGTGHNIPIQTITTSPIIELQHMQAGPFLSVNIIKDKTVGKLTQIKETKLNQRPEDQKFPVKPDYLGDPLRRKGRRKRWIAKATQYSPEELGRLGHSWNPSI